MVNIIFLNHWPSLDCMCFDVMDIKDFYYHTHTPEKKDCAAASFKPNG